MLSTDLLSHYRQISRQSLTVVDVETSGYKPISGRVIEVSVLHATLTDGIKHQQTHLINPGVQVPDTITRFTGITQAMVNTAAPAAEVWPQYLPLLETGILTAHNLSFDYGFIQSEFQHQGISYVRPATQQFCTVILARLMLPQLPSRSLPDLVRHFEFNVGRSHRAEADTLACWLLAELLLREIQNEEDEVLLARFAEQWLPLRDVAELLSCSGKQARSLLYHAGVSPRTVGRHNTVMYQRGAVERVLQAQSNSVQTFWF
ncbi:MAG TPA: 3'-5' exonuclease [Thermosynechococcaceae cyanobacterium]